MSHSKSSCGYSFCVSEEALRDESFTIALCVHLEHIGLIESDTMAGGSGDRHSKALGCPRQDLSMIGPTPFGIV